MSPGEAARAFARVSGPAYERPMAFVDLIGSLPGHPGSLYVRLQTLLPLAMDGGTLPAGQALPSERDLCHVFNLSRVTIRRAIGRKDRRLAKEAQA